jgi:hypothetical protein
VKVGRCEGGKWGLGKWESGKGGQVKEQSLVEL